MPLKTGIPERRPRYTHNELAKYPRVPGCSILIRLLPHSSVSLLDSQLSLSHSSASLAHSSIELKTFLGKSQIPRMFVLFLLQVSYIPQEAIPRQVSNISQYVLKFIGIPIFLDKSPTFQHFDKSPTFQHSNISIGLQHFLISISHRQKVFDFS